MNKITKMNKLKVCLAMILLICLSCLFCGCGVIDNFREWKNGAEDSEQDANITIKDDLTATGADTGTTNDNRQDADQEQNDQATDATEQKEVTLYFANKEGTALVAEKRSISKQEGLARATINELINGPQSSDLYPTIPSATILEDINITSEGLCTVDFSSELVDNHSGGNTAEQLTVYSIVNTLSQFASVDEVRILIDGKAVETIAGHIDVSTAMAPNKSLIKE